MKPRIPDSVAVAAPILVLLVAVAIGVGVVRHSESPQSSPAAPPPPLPTVTPMPSATPADRGTPDAPATSATPRAREPSPSLPTATSTVCVPRHRSSRLTVVTFNMHSARDRDDRVQLTTIGNELGRWDADVVLLQEVDRGRLWTDRLDMPALLADRLGMAWSFGANVRRSPTNQYGTAILSRYPILSSRNTPLPAPRGTQQRGLLHATIDVRGTRVSVYDTHLENTSPTARLQQIRTIAPILRADPNPTLFGGDLNSAPSSSVVATAGSILTDSWQSVGAGSGRTAPGRSPRVRIEYLFYGGGTDVDLSPLSAEVLPSAVSDHRAVRVTYRITSDEGEVCVPVLQEPGR